MKVVLARIQDRGDREAAMIVADAFLDLFHLLGAVEQEDLRARQLLGAGVL